MDREQYGHAYQALEKAGGHEKYVEKYWPGKRNTIKKLIDLMRGWKTDRCEIFSTVYAAWNDLLLNGGAITDKSILNEILYHWHPAKRNITEDRWRAAIGWMKREGFVPMGFGKSTSKGTKNA